MNEKLIQYVNEVFAPYDGIKTAEELKHDLLSDLQERYVELKSEGKEEEAAFELTLDSIGDMMDNPTYTALKEMNAELSKVKKIWQAGGLT